MPFGDTAKKIQRLSTLAERVESTSDQIESMDRELAEQRAIVEALAAEQGVDVDEIVAEVRAAEADETDAAEDATSDDEDGTGDSDAESGTGDDEGSTADPA
ncbi:hypothetical protein BRC67_11845 [Halobacteriales archaeon QH_3_68_24]|nr:MAG: hypothetical protein BRC67_11845 [Halobacteriales archaeon QH_3_68_24]